MSSKALKTVVNLELELLRRVAEKASEPLHPGSDPDKTLKQWRSELRDVLQEVIEYVTLRGDDEHTPS